MIALLALSMVEGLFALQAELSNGRVTVTFKAGAPVDLQGRATLGGKLASAEAVEKGIVHATFEDGSKLAFKLKRGDVAVEVAPLKNARTLRVGCPGRFAVLPDFFSDDIVIDARKIPLASVEVPSENFLLHPTASGDAIVMCVFENKAQDVRLAADQGLVTGSEIAFGTSRIWIAPLEAKGIWHAAEVAAPGHVMELDWTMPYRAAWRVDFTRSNDLTDSWDLLLHRGDHYVKPAWLGGGEERIKADRKRWTTVLKTFLYPAWSDEKGRASLQPLKHEAIVMRGPALIYPFNRVPETPAEVFTVVDVARNTLGQGPCEYILDQEGQKSENKGWATCHTRDVLNGIYGKGEQQARKADVEKALDQVLVFVKHIRGRITRYREFVRGVRAWLAARPEPKEAVEELDAICRELEARYAAREEKIKTPEHVAAMIAEFRKAEMDAEKVKAWTMELVVIGDNQDELAGECRWVVRSLRQKAALLMATKPGMSAIAAELRAKTQEILKNPAGHEGARH
ncbi:MAG TPA: hypothetical protein VF950_11760 [Planctomycetota bacterium]